MRAQFICVAPPPSGEQRNHSHRFRRMCKERQEETDFLLLVRSSDQVLSSCLTKGVFMLPDNLAQQVASKFKGLSVVKIAVDGQTKLY